MQIAVTNIVERLLPTAMHERLQPLLSKVEDLLSADNENSVSQRVALSVFVIRVASAAIALVSQVLLARWMGTFEYGVFVAVWAGLVIASTLTTFGFPSAVVRFVSEYRERKRPSLLWGIVRGSIWFTLASNTVIALVGALLLLNFPHLVTDYFVLPIYLALVCLPAFNVEAIAETVGRPFNWVKLSYFPPFIIRPLAILALMGIAILSGHEPTAVTAMWCALLATYATTIVQTLFLFSRLNRTISLPSRPKYRMGKWMIVALPIFLIESFYVLLTQIDVIFVSWLTTPEDTAVYYAATKILALVHFVYFAVRAATSPRFAAYNANGKKAELAEFVQKAVRWTFWPSFVIGCVMMVMGEFFLSLFGPEFLEGTTVLWILIIGILIRASIGPCEALLVMSGHQNICAVVYFSALFVNVTLNLSLIPHYGMLGAAVATSFALFCESLVLYSFVLRKLGIHAFVVPSRRPT